MISRAQGFLLTALVLPAVAAGYPLDGAERSGIRRLDGYMAAQQDPVRAKLPPGALLGVDDIHLALAGHDEELESLTRDPALQAALESVFRPRDPSYGVVVVDYSDPENIAWAGLREDTRQNAGSVGKVLCMVALFDSLARAFPDTDKRLAVLRDTEVRGRDWVLTDQHVVPKYDVAAGINRFSLVQPGDVFRLGEWVDHAISASANAAGTVIWREAMLLRHFGADYPASDAESDAFFLNTPKAELTALSLAVIEEPLRAAGIDTTAMRQGTFWTGGGKRRVPGVASYATPRELARFLLKMEQGRLVDAFSSLEMKRYMYMTKRRYRYAYAPELAHDAVFFKSGSLYQCVAEEGFACGKYMGNARNFMNSVVAVESPAVATEGQAVSRYGVALMSNVLRQNSAWDHSRLAAAIQQVVRTRAAVSVRDSGSSDEVRRSGQSD